ncbi:MAG: aldehyde dehydrogenase family protein [Candidatus Spechtbacterales bacterium]
MAEQIISTNSARNYEEIGRIETTDKAEVSKAVVNARQAFPAWRDLGFEGRKPYFEKFLQVYKPKIDEIAELQTKEMGKPLESSRGEVESVIGWLENQLKIAPDALAPVVTDSYETSDISVHREPYGVVGSVTPWNFPSFQFALATLPQLIAGNTVVFKHSEECVLTSKLLADVASEAGFPSGVFTTIYGDGKVGQHLMEEKIDLIFFTGSTKVGQMLYKLAADKFIPAVLEMGGSSPGIVFEDADLEDACLSVFNERNENCGQVCSALKRLFVHSSKFDEVVAKLKVISGQQKLGDPMDANTTMGPLVAERQLIQIERQVEDAKSKGATVVCGGRRPDGLNGAFYEPTILTNVTDDMAVMNEEVFGPVLPVVKFETEEDAIRMANATEYGLSAFVYSSDLSRAERVAHQLESGQVSINGELSFGDNTPFGGYKKSGIGRGDGKLGYLYVTQAKVISKPKV